MQNNMSLYEVVDFAALKLKIDSKSKLFLAIKEAIESNVVQDDSWLEAAKPVLRVHRKPFVECESCSA